MYINRDELATSLMEDKDQEKKLRETVRSAINIIKARKEKEEAESMKEELALRALVRRLISETKVPDPEEAPHKSTGINVLEDLLKKIIPQIEAEYKKLTTSHEQRASFQTL